MKLKEDLIVKLLDESENRRIEFSKVLDKLSEQGPSQTEEIAFPIFCKQNDPAPWIARLEVSYPSKLADLPTDKCEDCGVEILQPWTQCLDCMEKTSE